MHIRQQYIDKIFPFMQKPLIKILSGMRRSGKTTIIIQLIDELKKRGVSEDRILYINMESLENEFISDYRELHKHIKHYFSVLTDETEKYIFIDEIQEISQWERTINSLLSENYADITLTGSNAHLLASDIATFLSGRYVEFHVYPLTFKEFLQFRNSGKNETDENFNLFLRFGGFPGIHNFELNDSFVFQYLNSIYSTVVLKDVVTRNAIRDPALLDYIIKYVFDNCGNITTAKRISDYLKNQRLTVSLDKVINYINYLEKAFLIKKVQRFDIKGLKHLELYEKYYSGDIGLRHGLLGWRDKDISGLLENIVYLELLSRGYRVQIGKIDDQEIDFIADSHSEKIYIQVAYMLSSKETIEREFSALEKIDDNHQKCVLTMDRMQRIERKGIKSIYLPEFLLRD